MYSFINKDLLQAKLCFLFLFGIFGSYVTYLVPFLIDVGLSPSNAGIIFGLSWLPSVLVTPLWGMLIDKTEKRFAIFLILMVGTVSTMFPLPYLAKYITNVTNSKETLFFAMLTMVMLFSCLYPPIIGFLDSEILTLISLHPNANYGQQRLFGSIGFPLFMLISGCIVDHYNPTNYSKYIGIFYVGLTACICTLPAGICVIRKTNTSRTITVKKKTIVKDTWDTCRQFDNCVFLVSVAIVGFLAGCHKSFASLYVVNDLNGDNIIVGLMFTVGCLSCVITFIWSHQLIEFIDGEMKILTLAIFSFAVRFIVFALIENPYLAIPVEVCHAVGFGLFWSSATTHAKRIASDEISTTMLTIIHMLYEGLGAVIGSIVSGIIYEQYGGKILFYSLGIGCCGLTVLSFGYSYYKAKSSQSVRCEELSTN